MMKLRIDAHHHLWRYTAAEFDWLQGDLALLRRDYLEDDLRQAMRSADVHGSVVVQARQTEEETDCLLRVAEMMPEVLGVVGWLDIAADGFAASLERYRRRPLLKGLRHVVQGEPAGFLDGPAFNKGVDGFLETGLVYDLLILERQLDEAIRFVDRHPGQQFVLDHIAKPDIRAGSMGAWASAIAKIAQRPNVACKLSGMVTEANPKHWTPQQLGSYFDVVLEAFTPQRIMIGTDWPVLLAGCTYAEWWRTVEAWIAPLTPEEQGCILGGTAASIYRLASRLAPAPDLVSALNEPA